MANLQKLNPTQQELYNYLEQQTGQVNFEVLQPFTTQEMGAVLHISRNTVRCQLRGIFAKTGVTRQTELMRLLLNGVAPLA